MVFTVHLSRKKKTVRVVCFCFCGRTKISFAGIECSQLLSLKNKKQKPVNFNLLLLGNAVNCTPRNEQSIICVVISTEWSTEIIWESVPSQFAIRIIFLVVFFSVFVFRNAHSDEKLERNIGFIAEVLVRHIFNLTTKVSRAYVFDRKKYWSTNLSSKESQNLLKYSFVTKRVQE